MKTKQEPDSHLTRVDLRKEHLSDNSPLQNYWYLAF